VDEGFCLGYMNYGCAGAISRSRVYDQPAYVVTNELTRGVWKKNGTVLVKKDVALKALASVSLTKSEAFPKPNYAPFLCGGAPKPIGGPGQVGQGEPAYEKLYKVGEAAGADIVLISRVTKNTSAPYCPQNPVGAYPPYTTVVSLAEYVYKGLIKKYHEDFVSIDIIALDVKKREIIAWGGLIRWDEQGQAERPGTMDRYTKALTFHMPTPDNADIQKEFAARVGSMVATTVANYAVQQAGFTIRVAFRFAYEYEDETWKLQPADYFDKNFGLSPEEFTRAAYGQ
jgi:hypothetical protein